MAKAQTIKQYVQEKPVDLSDLNKKLDNFEEAFCKDFPIPTARQDVYPVSAKGQIHYKDSGKKLQKEIRADVAALRKKLAQITKGTKYYEVT